MTKAEIVAQISRQSGIEKTVVRHRPVNRDYQRQVVLRSTSFLNDSRIGKQNDSL